MAGRQGLSGYLRVSSRSVHYTEAPSVRPNTKRLLTWSSCASHEPRSSIPKTTSSFPAGGRGGVPQGVCLWFGTTSDPDQEGSLPVLYANSGGGKLDPHWSVGAQGPRTLVDPISCAELLPLAGCLAQSRFQCTFTWWLFWRVLLLGDTGDDNNLQFLLGETPFVSPFYR